MLNKEEFDFLGITRWHELGYKGQGITICSKENIIEGIFDDVFCLEYEEPDKWSRHGTTVMDYIRQVAPEAEKWAIKTQGTIKNGVLYSRGMDYLQEHVPDILTTSFFKSNDDDNPKWDLYKKLKEKGCVLCCAAGNNDRDTLNEITKDDVWKSIGACNYNNGNPKVERSYADGEEMDFVGLHGLKAGWDGKEHNGSSFSVITGFAGMVALVQCFFKSKTGRKLSHEELERFMIDNCIDLEEEGHDIKTGHGLFILPDPETIDIKKYVEEYMDKKIVLKIDSNIARVNGIEKGLDAPATILNNRTLVPLRFVAEELGCKVIWDEENREVTIEK